MTRVIQFREYVLMDETESAQLNAGLHRLRGGLRKFGGVGQIYSRNDYGQQRPGRLRRLDPQAR